MSQKEIKVFLYALCSLVLLAVLGFSQEPKTVPQGIENKVLRTQHVVDDLTDQMRVMQLNFANAQSTIKQANELFPGLQKQLQDAVVARDAAKDEAIKSIGQDPKKVDLDVKTMKPVPKIEPPAAAPAPVVEKEKK